MSEKLFKGGQVDTDKLPAQFPTHRHSPAFWESLGRVVATYGFLEKILWQAIFCFGFTRPYNEAETDSEFIEWLGEKTEKTLTAQLYALIEEYKQAVERHPDTPAVIRERLDDFITELHTAAEFRNILCHASWETTPDENGASIPFFVNREMKECTTSMDCEYLDRLQRDVARLIGEVVNTVTLMGWQFPGTTGPGKPLLEDMG